jgi:hypothetical protein
MSTSFTPATDASLSDAHISPARHVVLSEPYEFLHAMLALCYAMTLVGLWFYKLLRQSLCERPSFNVFLSIGLMVRCAWLIMQNYVWNHKFQSSSWRGFYFVLNSAPNFMFFTCYLTILFLWQRVLHRQSAADDDSNGATRKRFRRLFFGINGAMYLLLAALYVSDYLELPGRAFLGVRLMSISEYLIMALDAFVYAALIIAYLVYGLMFWSQLARSPHRMSTVRRRILRKVQLLTCVVAVCFTLRLAVILWSMCSTAWATWYFDALYFGCLELIPLNMALVIIHWRVDDAPSSAAASKSQPSLPWVQAPTSATRLLGASGDDSSRPWWSAVHASPSVVGGTIQAGDA